jgi:hypothetical protein
MFLHRNIHKYPDGKTYNQIDHILVDRRRHSNVLDIRSYKFADCDTHQYLLVAKDRERLAVNKQRSHRLHMERFYLKKLKSNFMLRSQIVLLLWKIWAQRCK